MKDTQTKRRTDDCHNFLTGKLLYPRAQTEQIVIGLIYKFMSYMNKEAIELVGQAKFLSDYIVTNTEMPSCGNWNSEHITKYFVLRQKMNLDNRNINPVSKK